MEWRSSLAAVCIPSSQASVHIIDRDRIESHTSAFRYIDIKTYCGIPLATPYLECSESDINCEACVSAVEKQQAYWKEFWASSEGKRIIDILTGFDKIREEWEESHRRTEAVLRRAEEFNKLLDDCLKHTQPIFTLELPDDVLLKLVDYGSVGEILLAFKLDEETRKSLQLRLGKEGFALVGSRLVTRGLLKYNDPIFSSRW